MVDPLEARAAPEAELIRQISVRCGGRSAPSAPEVQDVLESGFARLWSLEAQLQRATEETPPAEELRRLIDRMRAMLAELRDSTVPPKSSVLPVVGFVLPSAKR